MLTFEAALNFRSTVKEETDTPITKVKSNILRSNPEKMKLIAL